METILLKRLAKLHTDPRCCAEEYRAAQESVRRQEDFVQALQVLTALADPHRLAIVKLLERYGEMCACDIEAAFDLAHSTVIHHLTLLAKAGLVEIRKDGKWSYYRLSKSFSSQLQMVTKAIGSPPVEPIRCCCCKTHTKGGD
ncbi:MAG: metalloregulator ArsR/SmtB family transcription factor [Armatimonadota bacterium]|nr:metalloregulator ArsR/SmtB family transcription factor [Armatimonadota bacterium]